MKTSIGDPLAVPGFRYRGWVRNRHQSAQRGRMRREAGKAVGDQPGNAGQVVGWDRVRKKRDVAQRYGERSREIWCGVAYCKLRESRAKFEV